MCYSAQIVQVVRKLHRHLGVRLDYEETFRLFMRRLEDPGIVVSRGFEANFDEPANPQERDIKALIDEHRGRSATRMEHELFTQKARLAKAQRALEHKATQKARDEVRIAGRKIDSLTGKLSDLRRLGVESRDNRIFPMVYCGVIVRSQGQNLLTPMRYFCRPAGRPASYDKKYPGLYNARRDNLGKFWSGQFGRDHALMMVDSFYENVRLHAPAEKNVVLHFTPEPAQPLFIACLWSHWTDPREPDVRGFAAITDEPPAQVAAAGHDRCIINLRPEHVAAWLEPGTRSGAELQAILSDRAIPSFQHTALAAA